MRGAITDTVGQCARKYRLARQRAQSIINGVICYLKGVDTQHAPKQTYYIQVPREQEENARLYSYQ